MTGKKPKIALCLSGEPRSSMFCFPYIYETFLKETAYYDIDVYIHSWKGFRALDLYNPKKYRIEFINEPIFVNNIVKNINKLPTDLNTMFSVSETFTPNVNVFKNSLLMLSSIKKSFSLIEESYDVYIRCRPDIFFRNKFWIVPILKDILNKKYDMFIPLNFAFKTTPNHYSDQIAIGTYSSMQLYSNLIDNLNILISKTNKWNPEIWLKYWLDINNIKVSQHFIDHVLIRQSYVKTNLPDYNNFLDE